MIFLLLIGLPAFAGVAGSKHDLSVTGGGTWGSTTEDEICVFCHTPHHANPAATPLWNRDLPTGTYSLYTSGTLQAVPGQPAGDSLLCLSCHDGTIALNAILNPAGAIPAMNPGGDQLGDIYYPSSPVGMGANIGGNYGGNTSVNDLSDDHPVSFVFDAALVGADGELQLPDAASALELKGAGDDRLECTTCHNVHDSTFDPFLVMSNTGSEMCFACHLK